MSMEYNVIQEKLKSPPVDFKDERTKCSHCNQYSCGCKDDLRKKLSKPTKRGYKSHVPSACVNCKTAHLACDISRPCKRCVALNKTDTCHDMQHKKRGRPKLREKRVYSVNDNNYEILYGTIQTPAITIKPAATKKIIPAQQQPIKLKDNKEFLKRTSVISFVHEPIESFQQVTPPSSNDSRQETPPNPLLLSVESVLPSSQLSNVDIPQPLFLNDSNSLIQSYNDTDSDNIIPFNTSFNPPNDNTVTIILSMEVCCAKVSDQVIKCWGYYPQELAHRSLYDFISPKDSDRMARLHRLLIDNSITANGQHDLHIPLPQTERTTSSLFSDTEQNTLAIKANGSRSFSDTIHIKKRPGDYELYEVVVYIGGGLGADLYNPLSLSKQYMVAQFKKHEYEVVAPLPVPTSSQQHQPTVTENVFLSFVDPKTTGDNRVIPPEDFCHNSIQSIAAFSPLTPTSPSNNEALNSNSTNNINTSSSLSRTKQSNFDLLKKDFPTYEKVEKRLINNNFSHISSSTPSISPKFNIAPIASANNNLKRFLPSISSSISLRPPDTVTHPTQQYFLQTSSSTLNAAASAAQNKSRPTTSEQNVVASGRKMEMSIRSLLC